MKARTSFPKRSRNVRVLHRRRSLSSPTAVKRLLIKKILVPIDFSPFSHQALKFALPLLKQFGAELYLVHVVAPDVPLAGLAAVPIVLSKTESDDQVRNHLRHVARDCAAEFQIANVHALRGKPSHEICRLARELGIDLIIMPTRGRTGVKHLLLGSTAEHVVRYSHCPVLVLKSRSGGGGKASLDKRPFKKILVPIDFSECSKKGFDYARALASEFKATLLLLNTVEPEYYVSSDEYARYDFPNLLKESERIARLEMERLLKSAQDDIKLDKLVEIGHAGQEICARASKGDIDLIVTSTHGRTGFKHVLVGSTAEYVVQHAAVPVLVVPSHNRPPLT